MKTDRAHREWPGKFFYTEPGHCHWCARPILRPDGALNRRKRFCNRTCVQAYTLRADPRAMRRYVYLRDDGICRSCGEVFHFYEDDGWEADHVKPLWAANGDWSFWDPENLQLLCVGCHRDKTRHDLRRFRRAARQPAFSRRRARAEARVAALTKPRFAG